MNDTFAGKTILITGGTGSIGGELLRQILTYDISQAVVFSRDEIKHFMLKKKISDERLITVVGDIRDYKSLQRVFERFSIDLVYHAAAMKHVIVCDESPLECVKTNIYGTQNIVDLCNEYHVPKMITISTDKSACPVNVMGAAKFIAERITLNSDYSCVRFGNVANSRGSVIPVLIDNLLSRNIVTITDPSATRFIMSIPDAVKLILRATCYSKGGDLFILKMKSIQLGDLFDVLINRIAPRYAIPPDEIKVKVTGLLAGEKLHEDLINMTELSKTYELEDVYVVLKDSCLIQNYKNLKKIDLNSYSSNFAEMISKDEIEQLVMRYLKDHISTER